MEPTFFTSPSSYIHGSRSITTRRRSDGLSIGLHKKGAGQVGATSTEALGAALCFEWIDGVRVSGMMALIG